MISLHHTVCILYDVAAVVTWVWRRDHATIGIAAYILPTANKYPVDMEPSNWSTLLRLFCDEDDCNLVWPHSVVFKDDVYRVVRDHIK
jgi:hypothetical protein